MSDSNEIDDILKQIKKGGEDKPLSDSGDIPGGNRSESECEPKQDGEIFEISEQEAEVFRDFDLNDYVNEYAEDETDGAYARIDKRKAVIIAGIVLAVIAVAAAVVFTVYNNAKKEPETTVSSTAATTTTAAPVVYKNPLTNKSDYSETAADKRPVALVVENAYDARPQWGIDDKENAPDIIVEGEVEGGESRMLWLFADYTKLPKQVGPMRSARPPFIKFSELFDSIFIHWGQSSSKGDYIGADSVFRQDKVDHINQMTFNDSAGLFGRDKSRGVSTEHTGVLYGSKVSDAVESAGFRTEANEKSYTKFDFNDTDKAVGENVCSTMTVKFSSRTSSKNWSYNSADKMYHTSDFKTDVARKNLLVLFDTTEYVVKYNYGGSGRSETYCNYALSGGNGKLASLGTVTDITWSVENGVLVIKDANGKTVNLNTGTTWIGYGSSNNGGSAVTG